MPYKDYCTVRVLSWRGSAKTDIVFEVFSDKATRRDLEMYVVWLNFLGPGHHLLIDDVSITGVLHRDAVIILKE